MNHHPGTGFLNLTAQRVPWYVFVHVVLNDCTKANTPDDKSIYLFIRAYTGSQELKSALKKLASTHKSL